MGLRDDGATGPAGRQARCHWEDSTSTPDTMRFCVYRHPNRDCVLSCYDRHENSEISSILHLSVCARRPVDSESDCWLMFAAGISRPAQVANSWRRHRLKNMLFFCQSVYVLSSVSTSVTGSAAILQTSGAVQTRIKMIIKKKKKTEKKKKILWVQFAELVASSVEGEDCFQLQTQCLLGCVPSRLLYHHATCQQLPPQTKKAHFKVTKVQWFWVSHNVILRVIVHFGC